MARYETPWRQLVVLAVAHHGPEDACEPASECDDGNAVATAFFDSHRPFTQMQARLASVVQHAMRGLYQERPYARRAGLGDRSSVAFVAGARFAGLWW